MKHVQLFFLPLMLFCFSSVATAQNWSGILAPTRATDWSTVGVEGGIPSATWTKCGSTINAYSGNGSTINNAISSCGANQYVQLGAGTFTINDGIHINKSNVVLRGMGADQTKLVINGNDPGTSCHLFYQAAFRVCNNSGNIGIDSPSHTASWTSGYSQGTTQVTLSNTTGLAAGSTLYLDQTDDTSDGWPATGDFYICATTAGNCANQGGGDNFARSGRSNTMLTKVIAVSGNTVTIRPGVTFPNYRSSQNPGAWWGDSSQVVQNSGVENLSLDFTGSGQVGLMLVNCTNCWVKGSRFVFNGGPGSFVFHNLLVNAFHVTVQDNYYFGPTTQGNTQYVITPHVSGSVLIQNNILHRSVSGFVPNGPFSNSVVSYNFVTGSYYTGPGPILHNAGEMMNLWEGNITSGFLGDVIHGTHFMDTFFRNHFNGHINNPPGNINDIIALQSHNRFFNIVGNVLGDTGYINTYETDNTGSGSSVYNLGWKGDASGPGSPPNDSHVARTTMRWGNYDTKSNAVRFVSAEVPSTIPNFPNPVPGSQTLPASFYLTSRPAWFGSVAWPPFGPDVNGGDLPGFGGHANKIPAQLCYQAFGGPSNGGGSPLSFNADTCYAGGDPPPDPPQGLEATPH